MKLYIVGAKSPDISDCKADGALVLAPSKEEALRLAGFDANYPVCEVPMDKAEVLVRLDT